MAAPQPNRRIFLSALTVPLLPSFAQAFELVPSPSNTPGVLTEACGELFAAVLPPSLQCKVVASQAGVVAAVYEGSVFHEEIRENVRNRWLCLATKSGDGFLVGAMRNVLGCPNFVEDTSITVQAGLVSIREQYLNGYTKQHWSWSGTEWTFAGSESARGPLEIERRTEFNDFIYHQNQPATVARHHLPALLANSTPQRG